MRSNFTFNDIIFISSYFKTIFSNNINKLLFDFLINLLFTFTSVLLFYFSQSVVPEADTKITWLIESRWGWSIIWRRYMIFTCALLIFIFVTCVIIYLYLIFIMELLCFWYTSSINNLMKISSFRWVCCKIFTSFFVDFLYKLLWVLTIGFYVHP